MAREKKKAKKHVSQDRALKIYDTIKNAMSRSRKQTLSGPRKGLYASYGRMMVDSQQAVLGLNVYCAIMDEANFMEAGQHRLAAYKNSRIEDRSVKKHDNELLAVAEMLATKAEILAKLECEATIAFQDAMKRGDSIDTARARITEQLLNYCKQHYFSGFQRQKTISKLVKKRLAGYPAGYAAFEREVTLRAERLRENFSRKRKWISVEDARELAAKEIFK